MQLDQEAYLAFVDQINPIKKYGKVTQVIGLTIEAEGPNAKIGEICLIYPDPEKKPIKAEVVGFRENKVFLCL